MLVRREWLACAGSVGEQEGAAAEARRRSLEVMAAGS